MVSGLEALRQAVTSRALVPACGVRKVLRARVTSSSSKVAKLCAGVLSSNAMPYFRFNCYGPLVSEIQVNRSRHRLAAEKCGEAFDSSVEDAVDDAVSGYTSAVPGCHHIRQPLQSGP
jgi:hypothetical protein